MTVCSKIKGFTRHHERIADLSSLLAVILFFGSIWFVIEYQGVIFSWMKANMLVHAPAVAIAVLAVVFLVIVLLSIGSSRFSSEEDGSCFRTFRGRRHGGASLGTIFHNWVDHMEHVNKKHR